MIDFYRRWQCTVWLIAGYVFAALMRPPADLGPGWLRSLVIGGIVALAVTQDRSNQRHVTEVRG